MTEASTLKVRLDTPTRRLALLAVVIALAGSFCALATRQLAASIWGDRAELTDLQRAVKLDPGNADFHDRLGRYYEREARDPGSAVTQYESAVRLEPNASRYWLDLAGAYRVLGNTASQEAAIERAVAVDPMTPDVAWEAANLYMARGDDDAALREFGIVITSDNSLADSALQNCWRLKPDVDALLQAVVPAQNDAYLTFLALLEGKQETSGTIKVWDRLMQTHRPFQRQYGYDYIRYLLQHKEVDQAVMVWRQIASLFGFSSYLPNSSNLVVNGNFDLEILNAGFDWQYQKQTSVRLTLDPADPHAGHRSLLISFDGPDITEAGIAQLVAVQPNTAYNFSAYFKSGEMEGAGGAHFTIQDVYSQDVYYESDELKDSEYWKSTEGTFTTGPDCKLVVLHIRRLPAGSPMRGKVWVSNFHISRAQ
jgi:tetratricopeptide (TPR) repeat protein